MQDHVTLTESRDTSETGGPVLARTVLDLAVVDADACVGLVPSTRAVARLAPVDAPLRDCLMAAHLAVGPLMADQGPAPVGEVAEWWERAIALATL